jgi:hypothetical protein
MFTKEQWELYRKIAAIFMPYNARAVKRLYPSNEGHARFVHYTTAEAALRIVESKRFWLRNAVCMADYTEVLHGFSLMQRLFAKRHDEFVAALDAQVPGAAPAGIRAFNENLPRIREQTFIGSLSEHLESEDLHGRLSMWRAFGGTAARVAIVLNVPFFAGAAQALLVTFSPVAYLREHQVNDELTEVIGNIRQSANFLKEQDPKLISAYVFTMLLAAVVGLKHEGFQEEKEWRAFYTPMWPAPPPVQMQRSIQSIAGIPQHVYELPLDAMVSPLLAELEFSKIFDRLIIGPTPYAAPMRAAFVEALDKVGVRDPAQKIAWSGIPIRT